MKNTHAVHEAYEHVLHCHLGVWQLVARDSFEGATASLPAPRQQRTGKRIAALEVENQALRAATHVAAEQTEFWLAEVEHRLKNTFTTVQALAAQTARHGRTGESFSEAFGARLRALARSHDLLGPNCREGALLAEVVGRCLEPYDAAPSRAILVGPPVHLPARDVAAVGLTFHELATNAAKYGALSVREGRVGVSWDFEPMGQSQRRSVRISWRERGGPPVRPPERLGFGSRLLERGLAQVCGGTAQLDFAPHGVDCHLWLPLAADSGEPVPRA